MKVWLVGAGYWGSKVKAELDTIPGVSEVEVLDIKEGKTIDDIDTLDPVILATPLWQHAEQTIELLSRGHDVYVEKPMGENAQDIERIVKVVGDRVLMVGHIFLYNPLLITLKKPKSTKLATCKKLFKKKIQLLNTILKSLILSLNIMWIHLSFRQRMDLE